MDINNCMDTVYSEIILMKLGDTRSRFGFIAVYHQHDFVLYVCVIKVSTPSCTIAAT